MKPLISAIITFAFLKMFQNWQKRMKPLISAIITFVFSYDNK